MEIDTTAKLYYVRYNNTNLKLGPFSYNDLEAYGIHEEQPIWREGLGGWLPAKKLKELAAIVSTPVYSEMERFHEPPDRAANSNVHKRQLLKQKLYKWLVG